MPFDKKIDKLQSDMRREIAISEQAKREIAKIDSELVKIYSLQKRTESRIVAEACLLRANKTLSSEYTGIVDDIAYLKDKINDLGFLLLFDTVSDKKETQRCIDNTEALLHRYIGMRNHITPIGMLKTKIVSIDRAINIYTIRKRTLLGQIIQTERSYKQICGEIERIQTQSTDTGLSKKRTDFNNQKAVRKPSGKHDSEDHWVKVDITTLKTPKWIKKDSG